VAKLLAGDILGDDELAETLLALREQIEAQRLGNRLLRLQREWLEDVEPELRKRT